MDGFPGWKASLSFRPGDVARRDAVMLFLRSSSETGEARVFARSTRVGEIKAGVELVVGNEGECMMVGILETLPVEPRTGSSVNDGCCCWVSSTAVVLISGDVWVR